MITIYGMLFVIKLNPVLGRTNPIEYVILAIKDELEQMNTRRPISVGNNFLHLKPHPLWPPQLLDASYGPVQHAQRRSFKVFHHYQ